jgi:hypothetical protein
MSIFHRAVDRLADFIWIGRKVNLRFTAEYRTACYAIPIINKLLAEGVANASTRAERASFGWNTDQRTATEQLLTSRNRITALQG